MAYHVFFSFSSGLAAPLWAPKGTKAAIKEHIKEVERILRLKRTKYRDNPVHWDSFSRDFSQISDELLCQTISEHNRWVRGYYHNFGKWSKEPVKDGEIITPKDAEKFWFGFEMFHVPPERWTADYYREQMEVCYRVMRGHPTQGITFETKALTPKQAGAVIWLFADFLDTHDIRLEVPNGRDHLATSNEYDWCQKCGPMDPDDAAGCRKRKCPLREDR